MAQLKRRHRGLKDGPRRKILSMLFGNNSGGDPASLLASAPLRLDALGYSVIPTVGAVTPTFTRATTKTVVDSWGRQVTCLAGEVAFPGARRVRNLIPTTSENFDNAAWVKSSGGGGSVPVVTADQDPNPVSGVAYADKVVFTTPVSGDTSFLNSSSISLTTGNAYRGTFYVKAFSAGDVGKTILFRHAGAGSYTALVLTAEYQRATSLETAGGASTTFDIGLRPSLGSSAGTVSVYLAAAQLEDVTGQSVQTAGDYVSVGVQSAPAYHGSCVDGIKCFPTDLSGNPLTGMTTPLIELAATQLIATTADIRDMTTASWTLGATMTRARTSVGLDGSANSATRLTGGAVAATNTITYTLVAAASSRTYSAYVKRITGTGPVRLTQDNFATNTDISSQLVNGSWVLVQLNQSQLNAVMGFKIDTNGDAIDVDFNQFEAGAGATSRISTGGAVRNADQLYYTGALIGNLKSIAVRGFKRDAGFSNTGVTVGISNAGSANDAVQMFLSSATAYNFQGLVGGASQWNQAASNAYTPGQLSNAAQSFATNDIKMAKDGVAQTQDTSATVPTVSRLEYGMVAGAFQLNGYPGKVYAWTRNLSQSELNAVTA